MTESKLDLKQLLASAPEARARIAALPAWQQDAIAVVSRAASSREAWAVLEGNAK